MTPSGRCLRNTRAISRRSSRGWIAMWTRSQVPSCMRPKFHIRGRQLAGRVEYRIQPSALMPGGYQDSVLAIIGDSRDIREGEVLHLGHPVVQAAIEDARR